MEPSKWFVAVKRPDVMATLCALVIAAGAGFGFGRDVHLTNAWNGWAPPTLVWASDPATKIIEKDFLSYQNLHIGNSLIMWVYPLSNHLLGADPTAVQIFMIYATCLTYALAVAFLVRSLMPLSPHFVTMGAVALAILTTTVDGDLARFGQGNFSLGQYYGFAVALQIVVVSFAIRGEIARCGASLALLLWIHPMIAGITGFVTGVVLFLPRPEFKLWPRYLFSLFLVVSSATIYLVVMKGSIFVSRKVPLKEWIDWVRFSNCHWFPLELGVFTQENERLIAPLITILVLSLAGTAKESFPADKILKWFVAIAAGVLLTIVGLLNSIAPVSMFLTMASLHRASGLILILALPLACRALYNAVKDKGASGVLAVVIFASPFLGSYGFPMLPAIMLFFKTRSLQIPGNALWNFLIKAFIYCTVGLAFVDLLWLIFGLGASPLAPSLVGSPNAWILGGLYGVVGLAEKSKFVSKNFVQKFSPYSLGIIFLLLIALRLENIWKRYPLIDNRRLAEDYFEVQNWARTNTPPGSLFMTDPTHCYGWKDYSARPSWGNFRDWIHSSIVYHADADLFNEGLRRAKRLGVDPQAYLDRAKAGGELTVNGKQYSDLTAALKRAYYLLNKETAAQLVETEKIDYFVFEKKSAPILSGKVKFFNKSFVVYQAR